MPYVQQRNYYGPVPVPRQVLRGQARVQRFITNPTVSLHPTLGSDSDES
jgi:hypothetical protein